MAFKAQNTISGTVGGCNSPGNYQQKLCLNLLAHLNSIIRNQVNDLAIVIIYSSVRGKIFLLCCFVF